ncbi:hypothetical protein [Streptomyces palmae]|uniref:Uncharacterized protein n=1 Tax=Streptomyces palmae TaxID=1701085 RepID=A0A4Z0GNQ0_9ACTN|nr:hypothetical protein [Streptomyces palmae]TGA98798.1 hypothetical protein E4099_22725 [Streptomyces palmae]
MSATETSRYVRLQVDLMLEVTGSTDLTRAALDQIEGDEFMLDEERGHARQAVQDDPAEALAYLVDPVDLVGDVPGIELAQASWTSEIAAFDPEAVDWDLDDME